MAADAFEVRVPGWRLPSRRPTVVIAQLNTRYRDAVGDDHRLRPVDDAPYRSALLDALSALTDVGGDVIVYPEYAWPAAAIAEGLKRAREVLRPGGVAIMPLEHLFLSDLEALVKHIPFMPDLGEEIVSEARAGVPASDLDRAVVNLSLTVLRTQSGLVVVPQLKLCPAMLEEQRKGGFRFARGKHVRVVVDEDGISMATLICFDFVARDRADEFRPRDLLANRKLDLLLVPECNPSPLHDSYARGLIALFEAPKWAEPAPVIIVANVAAGTLLPGVSHSHFGFSRLAGNLGTIEIENASSARSVEGVAMHAAPRSLVDIASAQPIPHPTVRSVLIRPQESLAVVSCALGRTPTKDPTGGRHHTTVQVLRRTDDRDWHRIRHLPLRTRGGPSSGVPVSLAVPGGLGKNEVIAAEITALVLRSVPAWVMGRGGSGKTAVIAKAVADAASRSGARVIWLDLERLPPEEEQLLDAILVALGRTATLARSVDDKRRAIDIELRARTTVVVLDSAEFWADIPIPDSVMSLAGLNVAVVVGSRARPSDESMRVVEVPPFTPDDGREFVQREVGRAFDPAFFDIIADMSEGAPLGYVWGAVLLRDRATETRRLSAAVAAAGRRDIRGLYDAAIAGLDEEAARILSVVCALPMPVPTQDLGALFNMKPGALNEQLRVLVDRSLVLVDETAATVSPRHPFVRRFWQRSESTRRAQGQEDKVRWAALVLENFGGEGNRASYRELDARWEGVSGALDVAWSRNDPPTFLALWKAFDLYLWFSGRYHARLRLGGRALDASRAIGDRPMEARVLSDAFAKTLWHQGRNSDAIARLDEAAALYRSLNDLCGQAVVEWYRSRALRSARLLDQALVAANEAVRLARESADSHCIGLVLSGLGHVRHDQGFPREASALYEESLTHLRASGDDNMIASVERGLGRAHLIAGRYGQALARLEAAFDIFAKLGSEPEVAEVVLRHAEALERIGEIEQALAELDWAAATLEMLGSRPRQAELDELKKRLTEAAARRP